MPAARGRRHRYYLFPRENAPLCSAVPSFKETFDKVIHNTSNILRTNFRLEPNPVPALRSITFQRQRHTHASKRASGRARKPLSGFRPLRARGGREGERRRRLGGDCRNSMGENEMLFMGNRRWRMLWADGGGAAVDRVR